MKTVNVLSRVAHYRPRKVFLRRLMKRSAVMLIVREGDQGAEVLMIERAQRQGDPWSGHMAFPGGRMDPGDLNVFRAACRELEEELGVQAREFTEPVGRLSDLYAGGNRRLLSMIVTPFVARLKTLQPLQPNHEVADTIWVPLRFLADRSNREEMDWRRGRLKLRLPCYFYEGKRIWGLSLMMLDELLQLSEDPFRSGS